MHLLFILLFLQLSLNCSHSCLILLYLLTFIIWIEIILPKLRLKVDFPCINSFSQSSLINETCMLFRYSFFVHEKPSILIAQIILLISSIFCLSTSSYRIIWSFLLILFIVLLYGAKIYQIIRLVWTAPRVFTKSAWNRIILKYFILRLFKP